VISMGSTVALSPDRSDPVRSSSATLPGESLHRDGVAIRGCSTTCVAARIYQEGQSRISAATAAIGPSFVTVGFSMASLTPPVSHSRAISRSPCWPLAGSFVRRSAYDMTAL
jgi:hypothetical protein